MNGVYITEDKKKKCPVCKKEFMTILSNWEDWGWRSVGLCFCSYHCMREFEREYFEKKKYPNATGHHTREITATERKEIMTMYLGGDSVTKIAKLFHVRIDTIRKVIREESRKYKE